MDRAERAAYRRSYNQANKDKNAEYQREYKRANKDRIAERDRIYRQANKDKITKQSREYYQANADNIAERMCAYQQTPQGKKSRTINSWKYFGVVHDDYNALYDLYQSSTHCEDCGKEFVGVMGDGSGAYRCLDHCHSTGAFRAVVCPGCNIKRGP
jgi:hypothetical protein